MVRFMENEAKKQFYEQCGSILNIQHEWTEPFRRRNRWNNRKLGNGRFPGFGLVQCFSATSFRVVSRAGTKMFTSPDAVYDYLKKVTKTA